ncbi:MAG TPA: peptide deformylase [Geminicoccaceae bacterium]|nr:peptide deformylase [Geminicoccaceae bacterium]
MAILKIARMGHPVLIARAREIEDPTVPEVRRLAEDMVATMLDAEGIGLAAPQVHAPQRLIVFRDAATREEAAGGGGRPVVLVNPEVEPLGGEEAEEALDWEGCLSIPGLRGIVPRRARVGYRGLGLDGRRIEREAEGLHARVVQHEVDHLDGVLYPMRMPDLRLLTFEGEMRRLTALLNRQQRPEGSGDE